MDKLRNDIERYLSGKMSPAERHDLEKRALQDPFLADALEGAELTSSREFSLDVAELNHAIAGAGKNRWVWPLRIAASVIGIAIIGSVIFLSINKTDSMQLASREQKSENKPSVITQSDSIQQRNTQVRGEQAIAQTKPEEKKTISKQEKNKPLLTLNDQNQSVASGSGVQNKFTVTSDSDVSPPDSISTGMLLASSIHRDTITRAEIAVLAELEETIADEVVTAAPSPQPVTQKLKKELEMARKNSPVSGAYITSENKTITGQVRDQNGEPMPGVNINVKGSTQGVVTNAEGKYSIVLSDPNTILTYSFIGFVSQEMKMDKAEDYADVQLMEDATQLSEVVVTGYGEKRTDSEPIIRLAEPVGGRKAYNKYLEEGKIYPQQALESKIEGKVVIEFTVSAIGTLSDFRVIKKLGFGCDEEVIRLVREGAAWRPSYIDNEPAESLVRIKTRFELPQK